jgi:predicted lipid-binding transport protein (Tim44 family)
MDPETRSTVVGVFSQRGQAERAVAALRSAGFRPEDIGVVTRDADAPAAETQSSAIGTVASGVTGTVAGGLLAGLLGSVVAVAVPGVGPLLLAGLLAAIVTSSAIAGALIGMGLSEEEARHYEQQVKAGRTLVVVKAGARYGEAWGVLQGHGALGMAGEAVATTAVP